MTKFEEDIEANGNEIERLQEVVDTNQACVETTSAFIFDLGGETGRIAKQEHILGKATAMCEAFADELDRTTELRTQQKGLLEALREALTVKLDQIYGSAKTRANQEEEDVEAQNDLGFEGVSSNDSRILHMLHAPVSYCQ